MPKVTEFHAAFERALTAIAPRIATLDETASTNDDARALGRDGAPHLTVVVADHQTAGRGRLGRRWTSPPGLGLHASWIVRPPLPVERWTVIPLLAGVAAAEAVRERTRVHAVLKWPNDIRVGDRKLGGILVEADVPRFCVVGVGVNVSHLDFPADLAEIATSIALENGLRLDRADLLAAMLLRFEQALRDPDDALARYRSMCQTLGRTVRVDRIEAEPVTGVAREIDATGSLLVEGAEGVTIVAAGDVTHLR